MKTMSERLAIFCFVAAMVAGVQLVGSRHYGVIYVDLGDGRGPAAIGRGYDVSTLAGKALSKKINEQLVGEAHILKREKSIGIELGQFVTESIGGRKVLACSVYDRVQMVFKGEGEATHGEIPQMMVEGSCENSAQNLLWIKPIWIPVADVLSQPTNVGSLDYFDYEPVSLTFANVGSEWPRRWVLDSIQLYDKDNTSHRISVERSEIREVQPKSILLEW